MGVGAAGLALVGCSGDDDDDDDVEDQVVAILTEDQAEDQAEQQQELTDDQETADEQAVEEETIAVETSTYCPMKGCVDRPTVSIDAIELAGSQGSVLLVNTGSETVSLEGWWINQDNDFWPIPVTSSITLEPGAQLRFHAGAGEDTEDETYAGGAFGDLADSGEFALWNKRPEGYAPLLIAYVAWGDDDSRRRRLTIVEARAVGLWGDTNVEASQGQVILRTADATGVEAYSVAELETGRANRPRASAPSWSTAFTSMATT